MFLGPRSSFSLQQLLWFRPYVCYASVLHQFIIIAKSISKFKLMCVFLKKFCILLCTAWYWSHLMCPFPTSHPHASKDWSCTVYFSLDCLYCLRWNSFLQITEIKFVTIKFIWCHLNPAFNSQSKAAPCENKCANKIDLCCCNVWLLQRSDEVLAGPGVSAMVLWVCYSLFWH